MFDVRKVLIKNKKSQKPKALGFRGSAFKIFIQVSSRLSFFEIGAVMRKSSDRHTVEQVVDDLLSEGFLDRSPTLLEVLHYLKDRATAQEKRPTSEYDIAQDVLKRGANFDPQSDTTVRVRIKRLRDALDAHFTENPSKIRVEIPPRTYDLRLVQDQVTVVTRPRVVAALKITATAVLGIAVWFWLSVPSTTASSYPLIRILPIQNFTSNASSEIFETGLQRQIATDLRRFGQIRVFVASPPERDTEDADFTLRGSLLDFNETVDLAVRLERESDNSLVYSERIQGPLLGQDYFETISQLSLRLSGQIGGQGGPTTLAAPESLAVTKAGLLSGRGVSEDVFRCLVLTDRFFDDYVPETFVDAYRCFERVRPGLQNDAFAEARWATLVFHTVPEFDFMETERLPKDMLWTADSALEVAEGIMERHPESSDAFLLLGSVQNAIGETKAAELSLRQAAHLNPGDPTSRAVLAYLFLREGRFTESVENANEAIKLSAEPQGYIYLPLTLSSLVLGDKQTAITAGEAYAAKRSGDGAVVIQLLVARLRGDRDVIEHLSPIVADMEDPLVGFSFFVQSHELRTALAEHLPEIDFSKQ